MSVDPADWAAETTVNDPPLPSSSQSHKNAHLPADPNLIMTMMKLKAWTVKFSKISSNKISF